MKLQLLSTLCFVLISLVVFGQSMTVNTGTYTAEELVQDVLINGCVTADNVTNIGNYSGSNAAIGYFTTTSGFPFEAGIVLSSGLVSEAPGSGGDFSSTNLSLGGDNDLDDLLSGFWSSQDAVILEFDFVPSSDTISFRYIFGSEEYPEYVNSSYNDVFGFFISGPIPGGGTYNSQNIALIPGTSTFVSIDNVNSGANSAYYVDNQSGNVTVYDGLTTPLEAMALVIPCQTYHIKLAIADAGDGIYDSGVFIEAGSFSSGGQVGMNNPDPVYGNNNDLYEGCTNYYVFSRLDSSDTSFPVVINLVIGGTATQGVDITTFPTTLTIPVGEIYDTIFYEAFSDGIVEAGGETVLISLAAGCPCATGSQTDTIYIYDDIPFKASMTSMDVKYCDGNPPQFLDLVARCQSHPPDFVTFTWSTGPSGLGNYNPVDDVTESIITISPTLGATTYYVTIADLCGNVHYDSVSVLVSDMSPVTVTTSDDLDGGCTGTISISPNGGNPPYTYDWWYNSSLQAAWADQTSLSNLCEGNYQVVVFDAIECSDTSLIVINLVSTPVADFHADYTVINTGSSINFYDDSDFSPTSWTWNFNGASNPSSNVQNPTAIQYNTAGSYTVSLTVDNPYGNDSETKLNYIEVVDNSPPVAEFVADVVSIIEGDPVTFTDLSSYSPTSWDWNFSGGSPNGSNLQVPPPITYSVAGTYQVQLTVENLYGVDVELKTAYINVSAAASSPIASFHPVNSSICEGATIHFSDQSQNYPTSYSWTFNGGYPASSTDANPSVSFQNNGVYNISLVATNSIGSHTKNGTVVVTDPPQVTITTQASTCSSATGSATASISGGTGGTYLEWHEGSSTTTISGLESGPVYLTVTDGNNCVVYANGVISDIGINATTTATATSCANGNDGTGTVTVTEGTAPYAYLWPGGGTGATEAGLSGGTHVVSVTDAVGCMFGAEVQVPQPPPLENSYTVTPASDSAAADGAIQILATDNSTAPLTYLWSNGQTTRDLTALAMGTYYVTVTDANGCELVDSVDITVTGIKDINNSESINIYPNPSKGIIHINIGDANVEKIDIVDMLGKTILTIESIEDIMEFDLHNYPDGVYMIRFSSKKGSFTQKINILK